MQLQFSFPFRSCSFYSFTWKTFGICDKDKFPCQRCSSSEDVYMFCLCHCDKCMFSCPVHSTRGKCSLSDLDKGHFAMKPKGTQQEIFGNETSVFHLYFIILKQLPKCWKSRKLKCKTITAKNVTLCSPKCLSLKQTRPELVQRNAVSLCTSPGKRRTGVIFLFRDCVLLKIFASMQSNLIFNTQAR